MFHKFIMNINVTGMQFLCDAARWQSLQKSSLHLQIQALTVTVSPHIGHAVFSIPAHLSGHVTYGARAVPTSCVPDFLLVVVSFKTKDVWGKKASDIRHKDVGKGRGGGLKDGWRRVGGEDTHRQKTQKWWKLNGEAFHRNTTKTQAANESTQTRSVCWFSH